ncbi:MAG: hypothetical protein IT547_06585 [Hyphomonadaceae bacterium]|nr:hypothetical protein [Hyphomonadaceae bacterium]
MSELTSNLQLPFIAQGQAQKHVTVNESLLRLDAVVQISAVSAAARDATWFARRWIALHFACRKNRRGVVSIGDQIRLGAWHGVAEGYWCQRRKCPAHGWRQYVVGREQV